MILYIKMFSKIEINANIMQAKLAQHFTGQLYPQTSSILEQ